MKFKESKAITRAVQATLAQLSQHERGYQFETAALVHWSGLQYEGHGWRTFLIRLKKRLLRDRRIMLFYFHGTNEWKLLTASEQAILPATHRARRASRQLHRAVKEIAAVPADELPIHLRTAKVMQIEALRKQRNRLNAQARISQALRNPSSDNK